MTERQWNFRELTIKKSVFILNRTEKPQENFKFKIYPVF